MVRSATLLRTACAKYRIVLLIMMDFDILEKFICGSGSCVAAYVIMHITYFVSNICFAVVLQVCLFAGMVLWKMGRSVTPQFVAALTAKK